MRKPMFFNSKPLTDRYTYKHNLRLSPHQRPPHLHDYDPHAKPFGNYGFILCTPIIIESYPCIMVLVALRFGFSRHRWLWILRALVACTSSSVMI